MHPGVEESTPRVEVSLVTAHGLAALVTLLASLAFGIVAAIELLLPDLFGGVSWLSWGRVRYAHTQGVILGWLGNVFFAFLYHAVPILSGRPVTSALSGTVALRALESRGDGARLDPCAGRDQPAARVGRVPARH